MERTVGLDFDFLWEIRGFLDKMIGGYKRGRRSQCDKNQRLFRLLESYGFKKENERLFLLLNIAIAVFILSNPSFA